VPPLQRWPGRRGRRGSARAVLLSCYGNVPPEHAAHVMGMLLGVPVSAGWVDKAAARVAAQLGKAGFDEAMIAALTNHRRLHRLPAPTGPAGRHPAMRPARHPPLPRRGQNRPGRRKLRLHPASPPGGVAPRRVDAVQPSRLPGQLPVPELAGLAALALSRCYEQLEAGGAVSLADTVAAVRRAWRASTTRRSRRGIRRWPSRLRQRQRC